METTTQTAIKASELRIGNWVKRGETLHQILPMDFIYLYGDEDTEFGAIYSPILLSPEILEKCGFEKEGITSMSLAGFPLYFKITESGLECWGIHWIGKMIQMPCIYLHQLQNLYYCLAGEELPVTL